MERGGSISAWRTSNTGSHSIVHAQWEASRGFDRADSGIPVALLEAYLHTLRFGPDLLLHARQPATLRLGDRGRPSDLGHWPHFQRQISLISA